MTGPAAFMSYARDDDQSARGQLTKLCKDLSDEVETQTGRPFEIFQDRKSIQWGEHWQSRIEKGLDGASFLIAVITPRFFRSDACRREVMRFAHRERDLQRNDLILPLLFVDVEPVRGRDASTQEVDDVVSLVRSRQNVDWRDFRDVPLRSPKQRTALKQLARRITSALDSPSEPTQPESAPQAKVLSFPFLPSPADDAPQTRTTRRYSKL